jgi:hypothetical protein
MKRVFFLLLVAFLVIQPNPITRSATESAHVAVTSTAVQFQLPSCSYNAAMPGSGYQIIPQPAPVTFRQQQLFDWFSPWAIARNPILQNMRFPILVLAGEKNARAGAFGIAINPQWFAELDEDVTIGIYGMSLATFRKRMDSFPEISWPCNTVLRARQIILPAPC